MQAASYIVGFLGVFRCYDYFLLPRCFDMIRMNKSTALNQFRSILIEDGIRAALMFLNSLTDHRFTALYRFDDEVVRNLYFFDRQNPDVELSTDVPMMASYCVFVRNSGQPLIISDAPQDLRLEGHVARHEVQSYCAIPLLDMGGRMFGTICIFDYIPLPIEDGVVELMESIAPMIQYHDRLIERMSAERREAQE